MYAHGTWPEKQLDHINGIRDDNRLVNLREATPAENQQNRALHPLNTSGHPGVTWNKKERKWHAKIAVANKRYHLGLFDTVEEAAAAYADAKKKHHLFNPEVR